MGDKSPLIMNEKGRAMEDKSSLIMNEKGRSTLIRVKQPKGRAMGDKSPSLWTKRLFDSNQSQMT